MKQTNCRNQGWLVGEGDPIQPTFIQNGALVDASSLWPCTRGGPGLCVRPELKNDLFQFLAYLI
jgi:hypothetical protein